MVVSPKYICGLAGAVGGTRSIPSTYYSPIMLTSPSMHTCCYRVKLNAGRDGRLTWLSCS